MITAASEVGLQTIDDTPVLSDEDVIGPDGRKAKLYVHYHGVLPEGAISPDTNMATITTSEHRAKFISAIDTVDNPFAIDDMHSLREVETSLEAKGVPKDIRVQILRALERDTFASKFDIIRDATRGNFSAVVSQIGPDPRTVQREKQVAKEETNTRGW
ncbi:MAG: hypothetical protein O2904_03100 [bacterium]|nr:hypothetical protein [bacterium]